MQELLSDEWRKFNWEILNTQIDFFIRRTMNGDIITPAYQRPIVWSLIQKQNLIKSLFFGIPIPPLIMNYRSDWKRTLVDGLQRYSSIIWFINNEYHIDGIFYSDLAQNKKRKFENFSLPYIKTNFQTIEEEKNFYEIFNTSGTIHDRSDFD